ncbi:MAG: hypothetical protein FWG92_05770 [Leptospirales bacterium]|nr:hypothetical protein [Leptospirales bacterium]
MRFEPRVVPGTLGVKFKTYVVLAACFKRKESVGCRLARSGRAAVNGAKPPVGIV